VTGVTGPRATVGDDRFELLRRIALEEPRPPRRIDPAIPRDLETIVLKAMAKDPGERYTTALELADDLGRFLQNRPILARPPSAIDRAVKWMRRHKPAVAAAAVVLLATVMGLGAAALWRDGVLRRHNSELSTALERAEQNESSTRRLWYDSQMRLAQQAWASGQVELAQEILEGLRPESGGRDLRGFEWHYLRRICRGEGKDPQGKCWLEVKSAALVYLNTLPCWGQHSRCRFRCWRRRLTLRLPVWTVSGLRGYHNFRAVF
jgi:hypothetical protein